MLRCQQMEAPRDFDKKFPILVVRDEQVLVMVLQL